MPTVREKLMADATAGGGALSVRRLFILFSAHARQAYSYSATKLKGSEGNTLLGRPAAENVTVDCASVAEALAQLLTEAIQGENAKTVSVGYGSSFATAEQSRCFDPRVVGNVRLPAGTWGQTGRCVFAKHFFVETGSGTRWFLDPCMFTSYTTADEAMSWKFLDGGGSFYGLVKRVVGKPELVLIRLPAGCAAPTGFASGFVLFSSSDFPREQLSAFDGKAQNKGVSDTEYARAAAAAFDRINTLLHDRAGIAQSHAMPG